MQYLIADHRDLVRLSTPEDPNYITLKIALIGAIDDLLAGGMQIKDSTNTVPDRQSLT